jgi:A/G-specific adenine glycosylase
MCISEQLLNWYKSHQRDLPWRKTNNPYKIWLSEIILQQTRVDQGMDYYYRFIEMFPTVQALAQTEEQTVLRLWQGLGYYSRARNLHKTAKAIVNDHNGIFPNNYTSILQLKGIGKYTAAAIASHAFGLPFAVVDGNVYRFLARYFAIDTAIDTSAGQKTFLDLAQNILNKEMPSVHNQAIMEFGALYCKPKKPDCLNCIFVAECRAFTEKRVNVLPYKKGKTKVRNRFLNYWVIKDEDEKLFLKKRNEKDVWQNLYDFPLFESDENLSETALFDSNAIIDFIGNSRFVLKKISPVKVHLLSHQKLHIRFIELHLSGQLHTEKELQKFTSAEIEKLPLPKPIEEFLSDFY